MIIEKRSHRRSRTRRRGIVKFDRSRRSRNRTATGFDFQPHRCLGWRRRPIGRRWSRETSHVGRRRRWQRGFRRRIDRLTVVVDFFALFVSPTFAAFFTVFPAIGQAFSQRFPSRFRRAIPESIQWAFGSPAARGEPERERGEDHRECDEAPINSSRRANARRCSWVLLV